MEAKIYDRQFRRHQENQVGVVREVLKDASRAAWRCDPQQHIEGKTYEQVTRLLQVSSIEVESTLPSDLIEVCYRIE